MSIGGGGAARILREVDKQVGIDVTVRSSRSYYTFPAT